MAPHHPCAKWHTCVQGERMRERERRTEGDEEDVQGHGWHGDGTTSWWSCIRGAWLLRHMTGCLRQERENGGSKERGGGGRTTVRGADG